VPCVAIVGGSDVLAIDPASPGAQGRRATHVLKRVDAIAAVSASLASHIAALGIRRDKIHVLPAAVDRRVFFPASRLEARLALNISPEAPVIAWVGRMVEVKALDILIDAIARLAPAHPELKLYLIGDGPVRRTLERQVAANGLASHVIFAGCIPHRQLPRFYRAANVTVLPSHWEGMPNVLLESHACGTPFVATRVGAIPELAIDGVDEVVTPGDAGSLASALALSLSRSRTNGPSATQHAIGGWDRMAAQLVDLLVAADQRRSSNAPASAPAPLVARVAPR
jgi:teichuronic acid biosynthesis glycosyltransferase TuaC